MRGALALNLCHKSADKKRPPLVEFDLEQGWSVIQLRIFVFVSTTIFRCVLKQYLFSNYLLEIAACAAAKRAIGTRKGEQDT